MKCKNCGAENPDGERYCKKCKKAFYEELSFKNAIYGVISGPNWFSIGVGVIIASIIAFIGYSITGPENIFFYSLLPASLVGGGVTSILSYNRNIRAAYDYLPSLNGTLTGLIIGFAGVFLFMTSIGDSNGSIFLLFIPSYAVWGFLGGIIGTFVNVIREKNIKLIIPFIMGLIVIAVFIGYSLNQSDMDAEYKDSLGDQIYYLAFDDLMQPEADSILNAKVNSTQQKIKNLKEAQERYQEMKIITKKAQASNYEMINNTMSTNEKEYAQALGEYINLKYNYYNEMETGISLAINGDTDGARMHYQTAQDLISKIQSQENSLKTIVNKNPQLKQYMEDQAVYIEKTAKEDKSKNKTFT
jgi:hypothetical protein